MFAGAAAEAASPNVIVSEFRFRGPAGGDDEFVELYNKSAATVAIGGWTLRPVVVGLNAGTTGESVCAAVREYVTKNDGLANSLCTKLRNGQAKAFANEVRAQSGKALTALQAEILLVQASRLD